MSDKELGNEWFAKMKNMARKLGYGFNSDRARLVAARKEQWADEDRKNLCPCDFFDTGKFCISKQCRGDIEDSEKRMCHCGVFFTEED